MTRDIETKNKLTVIRVGWEDNRGKEGKGLQGACTKDPGTEPKGRRIEGGKWGWGNGWGKGKW